MQLHQCEVVSFRGCGEHMQTFRIWFRERGQDLWTMCKKSRVELRVEAAKVRVAEKSCAQSFRSRGELQHHFTKVAENSHETKPELQDVLGYLLLKLSRNTGLPPHEVWTHDGSAREAHTLFAPQTLARHSKASRAAISSQRPAA